MILPSMPVRGAAMARSGALRAASAPNAAMATTLVAGAVNLILDPIFIFALGWGVDGAAWASVAGRCAALIWAAYAALHVRDLAARTTPRAFRAELPAIFTVVGVVAIVWVVLALASGLIADAFPLDGAAAALFAFFCLWIAPSFAFTGAQFAANAAFNNLEKPHWSTIANWSKATVGTAPLVMAGAALGALAGQAIGSVVCGAAAVVFAYRLTAVRD